MEENYEIQNKSDESIETNRDLSMSEKISVKLQMMQVTGLQQKFDLSTENIQKLLQLPPDHVKNTINKYQSEIQTILENKINQKKPFEDLKKHLDGDFSISKDKVGKFFDSIPNEKGETKAEEQLPENNLSQLKDDARKSQLAAKDSEITYLKAKVKHLKQRVKALEKKNRELNENQTRVEFDR